MRSTALGDGWIAWRHKLLRDQRRISSFNVTMRYGDNDSRLQSLQEGPADKSISAELIATVDRILLKQGYQLQRSLGRVKGHAIFSAAPEPELIALGRFPDANIYPKIVTALDLAGDVNSTKILRYHVQKQS
ncbi:MAG: hypothetical protein GY811_05350 [Myxococcales bacterium]|nr:hypothetical protein [Myxococcales bacterium]